MRIPNVDERHFYEIEAVRNGWGIKELGRQYDSALYERLALSRDKEGIERLSAEGQIIEKPEDLLKDPYVLEFTGLPELAKYSETDLETKIIDHLQEFLLELGRGFTFVGRQVRFTFEDEHYRVDLVFFNRLLRCFVLFDLKIGRKGVRMIKRSSRTERRYYMNQQGFNDFLKNIGLVNYPFNLYTAENEQEYTDKLFVRADNLQRGANSKAHFVCMIDDYSMLNIEPQIEEYYNLIIRNMAGCLFEYLIGNTKKLKSLNRNERIFFVYDIESVYHFDNEKY